ncbi:MAG: HAD-IA family hydrolase [Bacteroides sp.]|nr:HAD-IA family hydrolase [Eubacterium sp.]MCM1417286.1 HAD-IA family hydrolase [Roseburia sp.]MCM1461094.1 HAD-IA family hydrolase [Bacteroides sp.]
MYRCVLFDLDGTLLNTLEGLADAGNYALSELSLPTHPIECYRSFVGNGIPKLIERMLPPNTEKAIFEKAHDLFCSYYDIHMNDKTFPYDGIAALLMRLKDSGIKLAVITNKAHSFAEGMLHAAFGDIFDIIFGSVEGKPKKPDPYWALRALETLSIKPEEALYVGDSGVDMNTAKNAGIVSCGVLWGFRDRDELIGNGAKYLCKNSEELAALIYGKDQVSSNCYENRADY